MLGGASNSGQLDGQADQGGEAPDLDGREPIYWIAASTRAEALKVGKDALESRRSGLARRRQCP